MQENKNAIFRKIVNYCLRNFELKNLSIACDN